MNLPKLHNIRFSLYIHAYQIIKIEDLVGVTVYYTLIIENVFWSLSNTKSKGRTDVPHAEGSRKNLEMFWPRKRKLCLDL